MVFYEKEMVVRKKESVVEERELEPKLDLLIHKTKEMQKQVILKKQIISIGIRHDFLCINICWAPKEVKGERINTSQEAQLMLMYQKSMFDCYYCIQTFCRWKTLEKMLQKDLFFYLHI